MKKFSSLLLLFALVVTIPNSVFAASKSVATGGLIYSVRWDSAPVKFSPITASHVKHRNGYSTTCSAYGSYTSTKEASGSISAGAGVLVELTVTVGIAQGIAQSWSHTTGASVSFGIPESKPTNYYRLEQRFSGYRLTKTGHTPEPLLVWSQSISYAPIKDGSYHVLVIYDDAKPSKMGTEAY